MRRGLPSLPVILSVLLSVAAVVLSALTLARGDEDRDPLLAAASTMSSALLLQAASVDAASPASLERFDGLARSFDLAVATGIAGTRSGSRERALFLAQRDLAARWRTATIRALASGDAAAGTG